MLTARHLARTYSAYTAPLILLVLTLSLSAYTASLAETMDNHTYQQQAYGVGADLMLDEIGASTAAASKASAASGGGGSSATSQASTIPEAEWEFLPVSEHLKIPGVQAAARVGRYDATVDAGGKGQTAQFLGIDRVDFSQVANWRRDYASASLGALMNSLATTPNGVLVPSDFLGQYALRVGDKLRVSPKASGHAANLDMQIVGTFDLWPTWYPDPKTGPLMVGNLDYFFDKLGLQVPYEVWVKQKVGEPTQPIVDGVRDLGMKVIDFESTPLRIGKELNRPERQGLFGFLSVGFAAAALMTVLGFLLYAFFSFRRRFIELGMLRALGLSVSQMTVLLASELAALDPDGRRGRHAARRAGERAVHPVPAGGRRPGRTGAAVPGDHRLADDPAHLRADGRAVRRDVDPAGGAVVAHAHLPGRQDGRVGIEVYLVPMTCWAWKRFPRKGAKTRRIASLGDFASLRSSLLQLALGCVGRQKRAIEHRR